MGGTGVFWRGSACRSALGSRFKSLFHQEADAATGRHNLVPLHSQAVGGCRASTRASVIDFSASLQAGPRLYPLVMEAWLTICPRLPVWEDALDRRLVQRERDLVVLTEAGRNMLVARS